MPRLKTIDPATDTGAGADLLNGPLKDMQVNIFKGLATHPVLLEAFLGWSAFHLATAGRQWTRL